MGSYCISSISKGSRFCDFYSLVAGCFFSFFLAACYWGEINAFTNLINYSLHLRNGPTSFSSPRLLFPTNYHTKLNLALKTFVYIVLRKYFRSKM